MTTTIIENQATSSFEMFVDETQVGYLHFNLTHNIMNITSTVIFDEYSGKGFGAKIVMYALDHALERNYSVIPTCPFVVAVIERKSDKYLSLVRPQDRERFQLPLA